MKPYKQSAVVATLPIYDNRLIRWCTDKNPLADHCCISCHEEEDAGYSDLPTIIVGSFDVEYCCSYVRINK